MGAGLRFGVACIRALGKDLEEEGVGAVVVMWPAAGVRRHGSIGDGVGVAQWSY